jgi:hypothetical protein
MTEFNSEREACLRKIAEATDAHDEQRDAPADDSGGESTALGGAGEEKATTARASQQLLTLPPQVSTAPEWGQVARGLLRAHSHRRVQSVATSVQTLVRWRALSRALVTHHFGVVLNTRLWHHANDYRRRRQHAGAEPLIWVHLRHPEIMGSFWDVEIGVFPGETVRSVQAYALGLLASGRLIPAARAANWTCARMRRVCARMQVYMCVRALVCANTRVRDCVRLW